MPSVRNEELDLKSPPIKLVNEDDGYGVLVGFVEGLYIPPSLKSKTDAYLGLYFNSYFTESPYSFCYFSVYGSFMGHSSPYARDITIIFAIIEAWHEYSIEPHFWLAADLEIVNKEIWDTELLEEYMHRYNQFVYCINHFKQKAEIKYMVYGDDEKKYSTDRLFYPNKPPKPEGAIFEL